MDDYDDGRNNSSASSDFFSPISISFFQPNGLNSNNNNRLGSADEQTSDRLPPLHDSSWIGARLSPIQSFDKEELVDDDEDDDDDGEDERYTAIYHRALHESLEAASPFANERTRLLAGNTAQGGRATNSRRPVATGIHPLWDGPHAVPSAATATTTTTGAARRGLLGLPVTWGVLLRLISGLYLAAMGSYDMYCLRTQQCRDVTGEIRWRLPCLGPSSDTLLNFGALETVQILQYGAYWRILTSMFLPTSSLEWCLVHLAWSLLFSSEDTWDRWAGVYTGSVLTGQLWLLAWDTNNVLAGCVAWGTCGVLCAAGVVRPTHRYGFFVVAIVLVLICLFEQPFNSVLGALGSTYFGWAISSAGCLTPKTPEKRQFNFDFVRWSSGIAAISMLSLPAIWIAMSQ